jgi:phenylacetate-CoA ligase
MRNRAAAGDLVRAVLPTDHTTRQHVLERQAKAVSRIVAHAYRNVTYYRRLFDEHGIKPEDVQSAEDLKQVPITSRSDLQRETPGNLLSTSVNPARLFSLTTNGSSGRPLTVRRTWFEQRLLKAFRLRAHRYYGRRIGDKMAVIGLLMQPNEGATAHIRAGRKLGVLPFLQISTRMDPDEILAALSRFRPKVLSGYPGVLVKLAGLLKEEDRVLIRPRFMMTGAEQLTGQQRAVIRAGFGSPVYNLYGCSEFNLLAWECKHTGEMHTCDDAVVVDVNRDGHPVVQGEPGEVVVTGLHSYAMPLIRYRLDDVVIRGREVCSCGQGFSTIKAVQGRLADYFRLPEGRVIHPFEIDAAIRNEMDSWVAQYQIIQERKDLVTMNIVPTSKPPDERLSRLNRFGRSLLGSKVRFQVELVGEIPLGRGGKYRVYESRVQAEPVP